MNRIIRIAVEVHSDEELDNIEQELASLGYRASPEAPVKICGQGACGVGRLFRYGGLNNFGR